MLGQLAYFLVAYAIFAGVVVFLMTFGRSPVFAGTIVEKASDFIAGGCCSSILNLIESICGSAVAQRVDSVIDYCMWQNNPILPATYFVTVAACFFLYYYRVFSWFPTSVTPVWHKYTGTASVVLCCLMWFRVYLSNPGLITKDNLSFWIAADPPGDEIYPIRNCNTCELPKPARSKHCSLCKGCIAREDHHCGWIANCVGALNLRYFLSFIFANIVMMWYGAILAFATMWGVLKDAGLLDRPLFIRPGYKVRLRDDKVALVKYAMRKFTILPAISVFLAVAAIVVTVFFAFNAWNISWGLTGNDRHKLTELNRTIVLESRAESYVTDSPRAKPTPKKISYSKGFFRNWLEVLLPGTIQAAGSAASYSVPERCMKSNNAKRYGSRKKKK